MKKTKIHSLRKNYGEKKSTSAENAASLSFLTEENAGDDPIVLFDRWFNDAIAAGEIEPNAMSLATAGNRPSVRMVLLKDYGTRGFTFYTNYESRKAKDLSNNPAAALCFFWITCERQIRIEGQIEKLSRSESEQYFHSRPYESQVGAHASQQSQPLRSRADLENRFQELLQTYPQGVQVPLPENWGGYLVIPDSIEFWQGGSDRLHDRILFERNINDEASATEPWKRSRLYP